MFCWVISGLFYLGLRFLFVTFKWLIDCDYTWFLGLAGMCFGRFVGWPINFVLLLMCACWVLDLPVCCLFAYLSLLLLGFVGVICLCFVFWFGFGCFDFAFGGLIWFFTLVWVLVWFYCPMVCLGMFVVCLTEVLFVLIVGLRVALLLLVCLFL